MGWGNQHCSEKEICENPRCYSLRQLLLQGHHGGTDSVVLLPQGPQLVLVLPQ